MAVKIRNGHNSEYKWLNDLSFLFVLKRERKDVSPNTFAYTAFLRLLGFASIASALRQ